MATEDTLSTLRMVRLSLLTAWFKPNQVIGIATPTFTISKEIVYLLLDEIAKVPDWITTPICRRTMQQIEFTNGSKIKLMHSTNSAKGVSLSMLMVHRGITTDHEWLCAFLPCLSHINKTSTLTYFQ